MNQHNELENKFKEISGGNDVISKEKMKSYLESLKDSKDKPLLKEGEFDTLFE